jgi:hypothetical protein
VRAAAAAPDFVQYAAVRPPGVVAAEPDADAGLRLAAIALILLAAASLGLLVPTATRWSI